MIARYEITKELLVELVTFLFMFSVLMFSYQSAIDNFQWLYLLLAVPVFLLWLLRRLIVSNKLLFFISHLMFIIVPILLPFELVNNGRIFISVFMLVMVILSYRTKIMGPWGLHINTAVFGVLANLIFSSLLNSFEVGSAAISAYFNISSVLIMAAVILYIHIRNLDFNLLVYTSRHKRSVGGVVLANNMLAMLFIVALVGIGVVVTLVPVGAVLSVVASWIYRGFAWGFLFLIRGILRVLVFFLPDFRRLDEGPADGYEDAHGGIFDELHEMGPVREVASLVLLIIIFVGIIAAIIYFISLGFAESNKTSTSYEMPHDTVGKVRVITHGFGRLIPRFRNLVKHPIRRAYIKKVRNHIKQGVAVMPHDTPDRIADKIRSREDIDELTAGYEKVRYGGL